MLDFLKLGLNRKKFYKQLYKNWTKQGWMIENDADGFNNSKYAKNPKLGAEISIFSNALVKMGLVPFDADDVINAHKKYKDTFTQNYLLRKAKNNGGFIPHMNKTDAIREFILRGFVHKEEVLLNIKQVSIIVHIAPLVWPETFKHQQDAFAVLDNFGIPGYCGTILPKIKYYENT